MSGQTQAVLLGCSVLFLAGLVFDGMLLLRAQERSNKRALRLAAIAVTQEKAPAPLLPAFMPPPRHGRQPLVQRAAALFGIDPFQRDALPVHWAVVIGGALALSAGTALLLQEVFGALAFAAIPAGCLFGSRWFFGWVEGRRKDKLFRQFPDALAMIVRSVRVGVPLIEALRIVARESPEPTGPDFTGLIERIAIGRSMEDAVNDLARRSGLPEYRFFATVLALQSQTGGSLTGMLENLAQVIRKRLELKERGHALSAEARTSSMILAGLPFATGLMLWATNPSYIGMLFTDPLGRKILIAAVISLCIGLAIMRTIINRSLS
jgi:tight adherence protein B